MSPVYRFICSWMQRLICDTQTQNLHMQIVLFDHKRIFDSQTGVVTGGNELKIKALGAHCSK